jgi:hypothetical protein
MHVQCQQGFLFDDVFRPRVERPAPVWKPLKVTAGRRSFDREIDEIVSR